MTAKEICNALAARGSAFDRSRYVVVPNVSWGWGLDYEADVIAVSKSGWAHEVEIKISKSDLLKDREKKKWSRGLDERVARFSYAVPSELAGVAEEFVRPEHGIIIVTHIVPRNGRPPFNSARVRRRARQYRNARKVSVDELQRLKHLGLMRYWDLRMKIAVCDNKP